MRDVSSPVRVLAVAVLAVAVVGVSGCKWFRKDNALYAGPPETRPLEVPPDLDRPRTEGAVAVPQVPQSVTRSGAEVASAQANANGFAAAGTREAVLERVARALVLVSGLSIVNQAELLGTFEVEYDGESFMVRVAAAEDGSFVSAVDARGEPANGAAAQRLITSLKGAVAQ